MGSFTTTHSMSYRDKETGLRKSTQTTHWQHFQFLFLCVLTLFPTESMGQSYFSNQLSFPRSERMSKHDKTKENDDSITQSMVRRLITCLCSWWCNLGLQDARTAAAADGWCFQAEAPLQTAAARNLHPCTHRQRSGKSRPGGRATDLYVQASVFHTDTSSGGLCLFWYSLLLLMDRTKLKDNSKSLMILVVLLLNGAFLNLNPQKRYHIDHVHAGCIYHVGWTLSHWTDLRISATVEINAKTY